jgi:septum site-determining protein MinC
MELQTGRGIAGIMTETDLQIKGVNDGLLITLSGKNWEEEKQLILTRLDEKLDFYHGARLAIDTGDIVLKAAEMGKLRDQLSERGINLWAVLSTSATTQNTAKTLGLATQVGLPAKNLKKEKNDQFFEADAAAWIEKTLRAGYKVETKNHVVVMGDVNPGAEIISAGSILVWGRLSGSVHAGADGNREARVYAMVMEPKSLLIAGIAATLSVKSRKKVSEFAYLAENSVMIESWDIKKSHRGDL